MSLIDPIDWDDVLGFPQESLDNQIKGTDEHKLSNRLYKTEEEIERYMTDESLDDIDRAIHLLRNGTTIQKQSIITSLPKLLQEHNAETRSRVLPILLETIPPESHDFQIAAAKVMKEVTDKGHLPPKTVQSVATVARKIMDRKDEATEGVWAEVMIAAIKYMPLDVVENEILPEALIDGALAQPSPFRLWCAQVLGAIAPRIEKKKSQELFFKKALQLCQDTDYEVRACMCCQLNAIARAVGTELTIKELLPEYIELVMDEEVVVREAAIENIMQLLNFFDSDCRKEVIIPMWKKLCDERSPRLLVCLAQQLGVFLWECKAQIPDSDMKFFVNFYLSLISKGDASTREMCAFNYPALVKVMSTLPQGFESYKLDSAFEQLVNDQNEIVRRKVAAGLHEVAQILGNQSWTLLRTGFLRLFGDMETDVYRQLFKNLGKVLVQFGRDDASRKDTQLDDLLFLILRRERECATSARTNWRLHFDLLEQFRVFPEVFASELLTAHCVPLLFKLLSDNVVVPIKHTVVETLCMFLRRTKRWEHRERLCRQMQELRDGHNYHTRLLFLDLCETVLGVFSHRFFKENFLQSYLELVKDPVPNVRLRLVSLLPAVRRTLRLPADSALLQKVSEAVGTLLTADQDRDVTEAASSILSKLGGSSSSSSDMLGGGGLSKRGILGADTLSRSQDSLDKQREEEEQHDLGNDWDGDESGRRRDMDEARQEFAKRLADKDHAKKGKIKEPIPKGRLTAGAGARRPAPLGKDQPEHRGSASSQGAASTQPTLSAGMAQSRSTGGIGLRPVIPPGQPISTASLDRDRRPVRSANALQHPPVRRTGARDIGEEGEPPNRLPGLGSVSRTGLSSPRGTRAVPPAINKGSPLRRSQEILTRAAGTPSSAISHPPGATGPMLTPIATPTTTASGTYSLTNSGSGGVGTARLLHGQPKAWTKGQLQPLPKSGAGDSHTTQSSSHSSLSRDHGRSRPLNQF
ncbi:armadillo-type protein [Phlyctochytrium arcticum]|nr:armadillo-type protein [Phlyctochytrium arcticum]